MYTIYEFILGFDDLDIGFNEQGFLILGGEGTEDLMNSYNTTQRFDKVNFNFYKIALTLYCS